MKGQQKKIPEDIIHTIPYLLKVIKSINQSEKIGMKRQASIIKKQDNHLE